MKRIFCCSSGSGSVSEMQQKPFDLFVEDERRSFAASVTVPLILKVAPNTKEELKRGEQ